MWCAYCKHRHIIYVNIQNSSASRKTSGQDKAKHAFVVNTFQKYQEGSITRAVYIAPVCHKYLPVEPRN